MSVETPLLAIEELTAHYGAAQALFGVDLTVHAGETVALVGANGVGKTTLLNCIMGLMPISNGRLLLGGRGGKTPNAGAHGGARPGPDTRGARSPFLI